MMLKELYNKFTVYHYMLFSLLIFTVVGIVSNGSSTLLQLVFAVIISVALDVFFDFLRHKLQQREYEFSFPYSPIITALLIAGILVPNTKWYIVAVACTAAIALKHICKSLSFFNNRHIFNPAATGIILVAVLFSTPSNWWIISNIYLVIALGILMIVRMRRYWLALSYLIAHSLIFAVYAFVLQQNVIDYILFGNVFFACFMLIEPKTSPAQTKKQWLYGAIVAVFAFVLLLLLPSIDHNLFALLLGNVVLFGMNKYQASSERVR